MTAPARRLALAGALLALAAAAGCRGGAAANDVSAAQVIVDLTDAVNELKQENAMLQGQIDSLRLEVARQDTLVRQLAQNAGVLPR